MAKGKQGTTTERKSGQPAGSGRKNTAPNAEWAKFLTANREELERYLAESFPEADAEEAIGRALAEVASALPHYKYSGEEGAGFLRYLRRLLAFHASAGARGPGRSTSSSGFARTGSETVEEAALRVWRGQYEMFRDVGILALEELERSTPNRLHWQVFQRICLQREKPKDVAAALGKSMAMVYQTKKRMGDRCRAIARNLYANLQAQLEAESVAFSRASRAKGTVRRPRT